MKKTFSIFLICLLSIKVLAAQTEIPVRMGIDGLSHSHVHGILNNLSRTDIKIVGIVERDKNLVQRYAKQYGFDTNIVYDTVEEMVEKTQPQGVLAFNSIYDHLHTVEVCAPKGIHVMVEKPLAVNMEHATRMAELSRKYNTFLLTNYETTWYPSNHEAYKMAVTKHEIGDIRKVVICDGHKGPKEIGCNQEFLDWLTDPVLNGGGAVVDFGCYGANLMTWLMKNEQPLSVSAIVQQIKPDVYPKVDDEATIILTYPHTQAIIQASWNWPADRKDMEIYGAIGYTKALNPVDISYRLSRERPEIYEKSASLPAFQNEPFAYFANVIKGKVTVNPTDLSSLENNLIVVKILDAARESAKEKKVVFWKSEPENSSLPVKKYDSYKGLMMAGYQGWFSAPGDGSDRGWYHYIGRDGNFRPGSCKVDMWPDVSEYEKIYKTEFVFADGTPAYVMSEYDESTVKTHFRWMREYGVDGVFVQRFVAEIKRPKSYRQLNKVFDSAINAANLNNRAISIMYDLSGMISGDEQLILMDIDSICSRYDIKERINNPSYLFHNEKPLVAVWGVGFNDNRKYGFKEAEIIIDALKERGFSVLIGVPTHWRLLEDDTLNDTELHRLIRKCDIVMPWFVGRYNEEAFKSQYKDFVKKDIAWCKMNKVDYAPLAFPGFSWKNMAPNSIPIPRNRGSLYWTQLTSHINDGAEMIYLAMFDEIDEGTAIFKCATEVPVGASYFLPLDKDLGSDYYLWLTGKAGQMLRKQIPLSPKIPERNLVR